eukprot:COSAG01_NODE_175_length_22996_cov_18.857892_20_plen_93_part_00
MQGDHRNRRIDHLHHQPHAADAALADSAAGVGGRRRCCVPCFDLKHALECTSVIGPTSAARADQLGLSCVLLRLRDSSSAEPQLASWRPHQQ